MSLWLCVWETVTSNSIYSYSMYIRIGSDLSKAMLRVSSWVVTTGADSLAATCSSLGCTAPRRPKPAALLLVAPPFTRPGESVVRDETHKVSQNTSCLSWSTSITSALESGRQEGDRRQKRKMSARLVGTRKADKKLRVGNSYNTNTEASRCKHTDVLANKNQERLWLMSRGCRWTAKRKEQFKDPGRQVQKKVTQRGRTLCRLKKVQGKGQKKRNN